MSKIITYFENMEKWSKLHIGPTIDNPGPILLSVAAMAEKLVVKSLFSNEMKNKEIKKIKIKIIK